MKTTEKLNYIYPFLWIRKEDDKTIEKEIDAIKNAGIDSFVIESRPKELKDCDFCSEAWFERIRHVATYSTEKQMKFWILDDRIFPTGSANGQIPIKYKHLLAKQIKVTLIDVCLDGNPCSVLTGAKDGDNVLAGYMFKRNGEEREFTEPITLSIDKNSKILPLPKLSGLYCVAFLIETTSCPERYGFIDMLNPESVDVLIKEVYERHFEQLKEFFGSTITGFFSDEPRFANGYNEYFNASPCKNNKIGSFKVAYPFSYDVLDTFLDKGYTLFDLLGLFVDIGDKTADVRIEYMNQITIRYANNFSARISDWCMAHGVTYCGHVIEDDDSHFNTIWGAGNYFRAMKESDFPAIDIVLHQVKYGFESVSNFAPVFTGKASPSFYHFTLPRLASSVATQSDTAKGGLCELFGAYGWGEDVNEMLFLTNFCLARGINYFIPHAFSMSVDDNDCPPHFFANGHNPLYMGFSSLYAYMNRASSLMMGYPCVKPAVLYNADAYWSGKPYYGINALAKELDENGIDFDFIDVDNLSSARVVDGELVVGNGVYSALIVTDGYLAKDTKRVIDSLKVPVYFRSQNQTQAEFLNALSPSLVNIPYKITADNLSGLRTRYVKNGNGVAIMVYNEATAPTVLTVETAGDLYLNDLLNVKLIKKPAKDRITFEIKGGQALFITDYDLGYSLAPELLGNLKVNFAKVYLKAFNKKEFVKTDYAYDFCVSERLPDFSGYVKYVIDNKFGGDYLVVDFYGSVAKITLSGEEKVFLSSPAIVKLDDCKEIEIILANTLCNERKDWVSVYSKIPSCGIKNISVKKKKQG